jgi:hypothetical protein
VRSRSFVAGTVLAVLAGGLLTLTPAGASALSPSDLDNRALASVSRDQGIPLSRLAIVERAGSHLPLTGVDLVDYKVAASDGRLFGVSLDRATRALAAPAGALGSELHALRAAVGKEDLALNGRLRADPARSAPVALWAAFPDPGRVGRQPGGVEAVKAMARAAQLPLAAAVRAQGGTPRLPDGVPVVFANLDASQVRALEGRADVSAVNLVAGNLRVMIDDSATSNRYPYAWSLANGAGGKVAVHEDDGVDNVNPFLNNATHGVTYWNPGAPDINTEGGHATHVAGVIASTHNWRRGGAYNVGQILSANFNSFGNPVAMVNSALWAVSNGADAINMSWGGCSSGSQTFESRWVDYMQKAFAPNFVVSSGNTPNCGGSQYVASPSLGWNTTSVGAYWDHNTGLRGDDTESSFTEWRNPTDPNSGRTYEKPDVTAAGGELVGGVCKGVETTAVGGGVGASTCGTSFSAPDTSALIADVKQKIGHGSPEAAKAIVMAGATHNVVDGGNYRDCPSAPIAGDCRDGAGAIDAQQTIKNVANPGNYRQLFITSAGYPTGSNIDNTASFTAGRKVRAVIAWDSTATCSNLGSSSQGCSSDLLNADLDLQVFDPNGNLVATAASFQNSAEVVDFTAPVSGTYKIRTHVYRFDAGTNTYLGIAWNGNTVDATTPLTGATAFALNTTKTGQTTDKGHSFWDTYAVVSGGNTACNSFLSAETGLEKVYQITTGTTGKISASLSSIAGYPGVASDVDVILLRKSGAANSQNAQVVTCGDSSFSIASRPAGTYYVVVDGFGGSVAKYSLKVSFS